MSNVKQFEWLAGIGFGIKVVAQKELWIKLDAPSWSHLDDHFVNTETGETKHYSYLADENDPPRIYTRPSPFNSEY